MIGTSPYDPKKPPKKAITANFSMMEFEDITRRATEDGAQSVSHWLRVQGLAGLKPYLEDANERTD